MRHIVFALLIALLPLRSWAGDVMAIQMAAQKATQEAQLPAASSSATSVAAEHADCMEHAAMADSGATHDEAPAGDGHCNTCASCQACSAVALVFPQVAVALPTLHHSVPAPTAARFTSADCALGQKPPIS